MRWILTHLDTNQVKTCGCSSKWGIPKTMNLIATWQHGLILDDTLILGNLQTLHFKIFSKSSPAPKRPSVSFVGCRRLKRTWMDPRACGWTKWSLWTQRNYGGWWWNDVFTIKIKHITSIRPPIWTYSLTQSLDYKILLPTLGLFTNQPNRSK